MVLTNRVHSNTITAQLRQCVGHSAAAVFTVSSVFGVKTLRTDDNVDIFTVDS